MTANPKLRFVMFASRVLFAMLVLSCLISLMAAFMGGEPGDFAVLNSLQRFGILAALAAMLASVLHFSRRSDELGTWQAIWQHIPGWLVFVVLLLNSLVFVGELSFLLLASVDPPLRDWTNHTALVCLFLSSVAYSLTSATARAVDGLPPLSKARW